MWTAKCPGQLTHVPTLAGVLMDFLLRALGPRQAGPTPGCHGCGLCVFMEGTLPFLQLLTCSTMQGCVDGTLWGQCGHCQPRERTGLPQTRSLAWPPLPASHPCIVLCFLGCLGLHCVSCGWQGPLLEPLCQQGRQALSHLRGDMARNAFLLTPKGHLSALTDFFLFLPSPCLGFHVFLIVAVCVTNKNSVHQVQLTVLKGECGRASLCLAQTDIIARRPSAPQRHPPHSHLTFVCRMTAQLGLDWPQAGAGSSTPDSTRPKATQALQKAEQWVGGLRAAVPTLLGDAQGCAEPCPCFLTLAQTCCAQWTASAG